MLAQQGDAFQTHTNNKEKSGTSSRLSMALEETEKQDNKNREPVKEEMLIKHSMLGPVNILNKYDLPF